MIEHTGKKISTFKERFTMLCESNPKGTTSLANDLHVSRQTVNAWKAGTRSPKEPTVLAIANYFRINVKWLMGFDVPKRGFDLKYFDEEPPDETPQTEEARILAKGIDQLDPAQRAQALAVVKAMFAQHPELFE